VWPFLAGNVLGATVYVPTMVFIGWALGYSFGDYVRPLRRFVGNVEHAAIWLVVVAAAALLAWRIVQAARSRRL
jgi:membrane protein DedA with SNARE-associated domain